MAKDYVKGDDYLFFFKTGGSWETPTWAQVKAVGDLSVDRVPADVEVPERGADTGHLQGHGDPVISFTLFEDKGDSNVEALIAAIHDGSMVTIAVSRGPITTSGTKYWKLEAVLLGAPVSAGRGEPSGYEVEAKRHANSDHTLTRATAT